MITNIVFVEFSKWQVVEDEQRKNYRKKLIVLFGIGSFLCLCLAPFSHIYIKALFQRGAFVEEDTIRVAALCSIYLLKMPFVMASLLAGTLIKSFQLNSFFLKAGVLGIGLNIAGNYALSHFFGVNGIAVSTVVLYFFLAVYSNLFVYLNIFENERVGKYA